MTLPRICTPTKSYVEHYPRILELVDTQLEKQLWFNSEMVVELDKMQLKYEITPEQLHAVKTVLQLFLRYELVVGRYWEDVVAKTFPVHEVECACSTIAMVERAIHSRFYNQINQVLGMDKEEDYLAYQKDPVLNSRVEWLEKLIGGEDKILSVIIFSMTECALLFSSFAILKSFQSNGHNKLPVIVRGTNQSAIDEDVHSQVLSEIVNTYFLEIGKPLIEHEEYCKAIYGAVEQAYLHECRIIDMAFIGDDINGVTKEGFQEFVKYRLDIYLERIKLPKLYNVENCEIAKWFELNTVGYKMVDFFTAGQGSEYESAFDSEAFGKCWESK